MKAFLLFAVLLACFIIKTEAVGTVVLNEIETNTAASVTFENPTYTPDARVGSIDSTGISVTQQYELNVPVETVTFSGGSQGINLAGNLGAQLVSTNGSVSVYSGNNTSITGNTAQFISQQNFNVQSTTGENFLSSSIAMSFVSGSETFSASQALQLSAAGDIIYNTRNDLSIDAAAQVSFQFSNAQLTTIAGDIDIASGNLLEIQSSNDVYLSGRRQISFTSIGNIQTIAGSSINIETHSLDASILNDISISSPQQVTLSSQQQLSITGASTTVSGGSIALGGTNQYSSVQFVTDGNYNVQTTTGDIPISSTGLNGKITFTSQTSSTSTANNENSLAASNNFQIGSSSTTQNVDFSGNGLTFTSGSDFFAYAIDDLTFSAVDQVTVSSPLSIITRAQNITLMAADQLTINTNSQSIISTLRDIEINAAVNFNLDATFGKLEANLIDISSNTLEIFAEDLNIQSIIAVPVSFVGNEILSFNSGNFAVFSRNLNFTSTFGTTTFGTQSDLSFFADNYNFNVQGSSQFIITNAFSLGISNSGSIINIETSGDYTLTSLNLVTFPTLSIQSTQDTLNLRAGNSVALSTSTGDIAVTAGASAYLRTFSNSITATGNFDITANSGPALFQSSNFNFASTIGKAGTSFDAQAGQIYQYTFGSQQFQSAEANFQAANVNFNSGGATTITTVDSMFTYGTLDIQSSFNTSFVVQNLFSISTQRIDVNVDQSLVFSQSNNETFNYSGGATLSALNAMNFNSSGTFNWQSSGSFSFSTSQGDFTLFGATEFALVSSGDITLTANGVSPFDQYLIFNGNYLNSLSDGALVFNANGNDELIKAQNVFIYSNGTAGLSATISSQTVFQDGQTFNFDVSGNTTINAGPISFTSGTDQYINGIFGYISAIASNNIEFWSASNTAYSVTGSAFVTASTTFDIYGNDALTITSGGPSSFAAVGSSSNSISFQSSGAISFNSQANIQTTAATSVTFTAGTTSATLSSGNGAFVLQSNAQLGCVINYLATSVISFTSGNDMTIDAGISIETINPSSAIIFSDAVGEAFFHSSTLGNFFTSKASSGSISVTTTDPSGNVEIQAANSGVWLLSQSSTTYTTNSGNFRYYGEQGVFLNTTVPTASIITLSTAFGGDTNIYGARNLTISSIFGEIEANINNQLTIVAGDSVLIEGAKILNIVATGGPINVLARAGYNIDIVAANNVSMTTTSILTVESLLDNIYFTSQTGAFAYSDNSTGLTITSSNGAISFESRGQQKGNAGVQIQSSQITTFTATRDININANNQGSLTADDPFNSNIIFTALNGADIFQTRRIGDDILINGTNSATENFYDIELQGDNVDFSSVNSRASFDGNSLLIGQSSTPIIRIQTGSGSETLELATIYNGNGFIMQSASNLILNTENTLTVSSTNDTFIQAQTGATDISTLGILQIISQGPNGFTLDSVTNNIEIEGSLSLTINSKKDFDLTSVLDQNFVSNGFDPASYLSFESSVSITNTIGSYFSNSIDNTQLLADEKITFTGANNLEIETNSKVSTQGLEVNSDGLLSYTSQQGDINLNFNGETVEFLVQGNTKIGVGNPVNTVTFTGGNYALQTQTTNLPITGNQLFTTEQFFNFVTQQDQSIVVTQQFNSTSLENLIFNSGLTFAITAQTTLTLSASGDIVHSAGGDETITSKLDVYQANNIVQAAQTIYQNLGSTITYHATNANDYIAINSNFYNTFNAGTTISLETLTGNFNTANNGYEGLIEIVSTSTGSFTTSGGDVSFTSFGGIDVVTPAKLTFTTPTSILVNSNTEAIFNAITGITFTGNSGSASLLFEAFGADGNTLNAIYQSTSGTTTFSTPHTYSINARDDISFLAPSITINTQGASIYYNAFGKDQNVTFNAPSTGISITSTNTEITSTYDVNFNALSTLQFNSPTILLNSLSSNNDIFFNINAAEYQDPSSITLKTSSALSFTAANSFIADATTPASGTAGFISISTSTFQATAAGNINLQATQSIQAYPSTLQISNLASITAGNLVNFYSTSSTTKLSGTFLRSVSGKDTTIVTPTALTFGSLAATTLNERADITLLSLDGDQLTFQSTSSITARAHGSSGSIVYSASASDSLTMVGNNNNFFSKGGYQLVVSSNGSPNTNGIHIFGTCAGGACNINPSDGGPQSLTIISSAIGPSNVDYPPTPIIDNGIGRLEFVSEYLLTLNVQTATKAVQFDNFYARLGFFSDIYDAVVIQTGTTQTYETCLYYVCVVPAFHNAGNVDGVFFYVDNIENKIQQVLINYGLLNYKTAWNTVALP